MGSVILGKRADRKMSDYKQTYLDLPIGTPQYDIDAAWSNAETENTKRNFFYAVGGVLLATGLSVQFAF
jgi:hypothetical protein